MSPFSRRSLLGTSAAGIVAVAGQGAGAVNEPAALLGAVAGDKVTLPPLHNPTEAQSPVDNRMPVGRRLGVAVVGLGHLSLEQILPGFGQANNVRLTALVSGERDKSRALAAQYGVPDTGLYDYANFDRLRDNPAVDIVYIVLPNAMHAEFTVRAAQAGKHVLCEKPMATNVADAQHMVDACKQAGRKLMIAYRCQYEPHHRALVAAVRSGQHGPVHLIEAVNGQNDAPNGQWRQNLAMAGGGSLPDVGLYCLNAARYITGEEPVEVTATMTRPQNDPRFKEIEDIASFTLRFPSGAIATATSSYSIHESRWLRTHMPEAWIGLDPAFGYDNIAMQTGRKAGKGNGIERVQFSAHNQFAREMDHFAEALAAGVEPHTPGEEGLQDQKLLAALYQAAAGGSPVKLPLVTGLDTTRGPAPQQEG
jgi:predicted dehydrogenase